MMSRSPAFCAVILAAGESSRMGRDKALLPWPPGSSETFLSAAISSLQDFNDLVIVVAGNNEKTLAPIVYASGATLACNPDPSQGQFSSLQIGLKEVLNRGRDAAMVTLVDRPPVLPETLNTLREAFAAAIDCGKWAVVPEYQGRNGHPILIGREMIEAFLSAPSGATARDVRHQNHARMAFVPVNDPYAVLNINTPEDYATLI